MRRDTILRKNASQTFKKLRGTDWVVERMYQVLSQGKRAFDSLMLEMGQMVAEAIMYIDREEVAGPDYFPFKPEIQKWASQRGSGTIFFGWCNLRYVFCQNYETSHIGEGQEVSAQELAGMMIGLQERGCHNINFVTPEHVVPQILEALPHAIERGLRLPLVYNTSAYDSLHSIRLMDGIVDIYMPDFKLWDPERCRKYLLAPDYSEMARKVIQAMHEQVGVLKVDEEGLALRGVLVRHLVMPGMLEESREIMHYLTATISSDTYVNVMDQYYPAWKAKTMEKYTEINRPIFPRELREVFQHARGAGLWRFDSRWQGSRESSLGLFL